MTLYQAMASRNPFELWNIHCQGKDKKERAALLIKRVLPRYLQSITGDDSREICELIKDDVVEDCLGVCDDNCDVTDADVRMAIGRVLLARLKMQEGA